jgi:hypothetical protein
MTTVPIITGSRNRTGNMRITIQVTCESPEDAMNAMARLTAPSVAMQVLKEFKPSSSDDLDRYLAKGPGKIVVTKDRDSEGAAPAHTPLKEAEPEDKAVYDAMAEKYNARPNINPGDPTIGKIGTATRELILADLAAGRQPPQPKYTEHLKLLWKRGEVKYDGTRWYL